jgi:hypothetical protein
MSVTFYGVAPGSQLYGGITDGYACTPWDPLTPACEVHEPNLYCFTPGFPTSTYGQVGSTTQPGNEALCHDLCYANPLCYHVAYFHDTGDCVQYMGCAEKHEHANSTLFYNVDKDKNTLVHDAPTATTALVTTTTTTTTTIKHKVR